MEISYRNGRKEDCTVLAKLVNIASEGVIEYLFHDLIPDMTPVQMVAHNLGTENSYYSYENAIVAEYDQNLIGVSLSYPSHFHQITEEMKNFLPEDRLEHFKSFYSSRVEDSLFLNALCVDERFRGKGIGTKLISLTKKKAKESSFKALSLMVLADNKDAQRLYSRCGFKIAEAVELKSHELIPHEGGCLLMKCEIEL
ncbi:MAG: GNAT family N-acetyltransferase [bacterium]|nr:MAG: GNAT family N-acetyltransferase [bacterium]